MEPRKTIALVSYMTFHHGATFLLLTLVMNSSSFYAAGKLGNDTDQLALLEFKSLIADDPYGILSSWNNSQHHCQWPGVTCGNKDQRVTALNLRGQNLLGSISPHIGNLSFLKNISLSTNRFYGEIPLEIGQLYQLTRVEIANNTLGGSIPGILSNITELNVLNLGTNKLVGEIPVHLSSLKKLVGLVLGGNNISGEIPRSFGNLSSLLKFAVPYNNLQGIIPYELSKLRSLTFFSIGMNNLSGAILISLYNISSLGSISIDSNQFTGSLPPDFGSTLPNLNTLFMGGNLFTGIIPASFVNASRLQFIDFSANGFSGQVPNSMGLLPELQSLNIEKNKLGGNPHHDLSFLVPLYNCSNLNALSFAGNNLSGQLPGSIANLSIQLNQLFMGPNKIYGPIPEALGNLVNLYDLNMGDNHFSGIIPSSLGQLKTLQRFSLGKNQLSGQIPSSLGNISQLGMLSLSNNKLEGSIPESLGNCQDLQFLDLSNNNLSGVIPSQVVIISLQQLNLSQNSLNGPLPTQVGKLSSIYALDVSSNYLLGEIPASIADCLSLESLKLHKNSFQGSIPSTLASLKGIKYMDLSRNNLSGEIPEELGSLSYLQYLNLSFNDLKGEIPTRGVFGNSSAISVLGNSKLCGGMPELGQSICKTQKNQEHKVDTFKLIIALVCVGFFLIALSSLGALYWRRKKRKDSVSPILEEENLMRVTYRELYRATDGFSLGNLIGSGSFGSVYKGKLNERGNTIIAVKVLNLQNRRASKSFLAECNILRNIRHRNLLKILTYCSSVDSKRNEFKALVYEFMPKGDLDMWLHPDETDSSRILSLLQRVNIAIDVASALQYLHCHCEAPIVHCDLKPSNILLSDDMCACVGDFGLARFHPNITDKISEMSSIELRGSVGYAAPEYGTGSEISTSGDIYSYGIILLEMMTGRRPADEIFKDGLDLHTYVEKALPRHVNQIVDPLIYGEEKEETVKEEELSKNSDQIVTIGEGGKMIRRFSHGESLKTCIMSILTIGLACSQGSPTQRMDLNDVNRELKRVREALLGCERNKC